MLNPEEPGKVGHTDSSRLFVSGFSLFTVSKSGMDVPDLCYGVHGSRYGELMLSCMSHTFVGQNPNCELSFQSQGSSLWNVNGQQKACWVVGSVEAYYGVAQG